MKRYVHYIAGTVCIYTIIFYFSTSKELAHEALCTLHCRHRLHLHHYLLFFDKQGVGSCNFCTLRWRV